MACTAGPAFYRLVHMFEMQVHVSVPEVRKLGSFRIQDNAFFMTAETKIVIIRAEGFVERGRIRVPQYPEVSGTMRVVTARAVLLLYGTVVVAIFCQPFFHVNNGFAVKLFILSVMTAQAEVHRLH